MAAEVVAFVDVTVRRPWGTLRTLPQYFFMCVLCSVLNSVKF